MNSTTWVWVIFLVVLIGSYWLYSRGKLSKIRLPNIGSKPTAEQIEAQTVKEVAKAEELKSVLEAKRELAVARAKNIRLQREIDGVSEKSVEKDKREAEREEQKALEAKSVKPRRL